MFPNLKRHLGQDIGWTVANQKIAKLVGNNIV